MLMELEAPLTARCAIHLIAFARAHEVDAFEIHSNPFEVLLVVG